MHTLSTELGDLPAGGESLDPPESGREVRLLGAFDALLLGYRKRDLLLDARHAKQVQASGGMIAPTILAGTVTRKP